jgi:hypothetical protein
MKNSLFFSAFFLLVCVTSCQKEELNPINSETTGTAIAANREDRPGTVSTTVAPEYWQLCGRTLAVTRPTSPDPGQRTLVVSDMNGNVMWRFQAIDPSLVSSEIRMAAKSYFVGYTMGGTWQTGTTDASGSTLIMIESVQQPGVAVMTDANANVICNGTK